MPKPGFDSVGYQLGMANILSFLVNATLYLQNQLYQDSNTPNEFKD